MNFCHRVIYNSRFGHSYLAISSQEPLICFKTSVFSNGDDISKGVIHAAIYENKVTADLLFPAVMYLCEEEDA